jgi:hypothetical protein
MRMLSNNRHIRFIHRKSHRFRIVFAMSPQRPEIGNYPRSVGMKSDRSRAGVEPRSPTGTKSIRNAKNSVNFSINTPSLGVGFDD